MSSQTCSRALVCIAGMIAIAAVAYADESFRALMPEQAKQLWKVDPSYNPPAYPVQALRERSEGCVAIAIEVHADGSVTPVRLLHTEWFYATNSMRELLQKSAIAAVARFRYLPTPANTAHTPVYTYTYMTYRMEGGGFTEAEMEKKCEVPDFLQRAQRLASASSSGHGQ